MKKLTIWLLLGFLLMVSVEVFACAVCGTAIEASRKAFIYSTALLSLAPLAMIGGLIYYLFRKYRKQEALQNPAPDPLLASEETDNYRITKD